MPRFWKVALAVPLWFFAIFHLFIQRDFGLAGLAKAAAICLAITVISLLATLVGGIMSSQQNLPEIDENALIFLFILSFVLLFAIGSFSGFLQTI